MPFEANDLEKRVCNYIKDYMNLGFDVLPNHHLTKDIGVAGSDGVYFIQDFSKEFSTSFENMNITKHFACELLYKEIYNIFKQLIRGENPFTADQIKDIQVSQLVEAVKNGRWQEADI